MWISKEKYNEMTKKIEQYEDESGEALIERLTRLAKKAGLDVHGQEYQTMMHRVFMDIGGRQSNVLKGYSQTSFLKDNPEELLKRLQEFKQEASIITKELKNKGGKK